MPTWGQILGETRNRIEQGDQQALAEYLSNHSNFKTHGKHINAQKAIEIGLKIEMLEDNQDFQDKVLSAFHATMHAFGSTNTAKVVANQIGNCFLKQYNFGSSQVKK